MIVRRITRFRTDSPWLGSLRLALRRRVGFLMWLAFLVSGAALCYSVPMAWMNRRLREVAEPYAYRTYEQLQRVESSWTAPMDVPSFQQGDEAIVAKWLDTEPLLVLLRRNEGKDLWVRKGGGLVLTTAQDVPNAWIRWLEAVERADGSVWSPPAQLQSDFTSTAVLIRGRDWTGLRVWRIGSQETERFLQRTLQPRPLIRVGLRRNKAAERPAIAPAEPWNTPPNLQAVFDQRKASMLDLKGGGTAFGEGWEIAALPSPEQEVILKALFIRSRNEAFVLLAGILLLWILAHQLRRRARQRERANMDRLAAMAHSLKTPLSVLKLRCDSLRLGKLTSDQAEAQFLRLGEEVDLLAHVIERGLHGLRRNEPPGLRERVDEEWIRALAEELRPAFDADSRPLELELASDTGHAHLPSLRVALVTLLENALLHGHGPVRVCTRRGTGRLRIQVTNAMQELDPSQLRHLGKPFFRPRHPHAEGSRTPGNGLGLFLLHQTAEHEGWGFEMALSGDSTLTACLEIHG